MERDPGWLPDPSGRHELRWFDGNAFTDQVADQGAQSSDPLPPAPAPPPPSPPPPVSGGSRNPLPFVIGAVVLVLVVAAAAFLLLSGGGDGAEGAGTFEGRVDEGEMAFHSITVPAGSVAVVRLEPDDDLDAVVGFAVRGVEQGRIEDMLEGTPVEPFVLQGSDDEELLDLVQAEPGGREDIVFFADGGFEGDDELTLLVSPERIETRVFVAGFGESSGDYEITIDIVDLDVDDPGDGDQVLEAIVDSDDVPRSVRNRVEAVLQG